MRRFLCVLSLMVLGTATVQATVIDDFSVDSSTKYNVVDAWGSPSSPAAYGRNATTQQFAQEEAPGEGWTSTDFLRNDGYTFNVGSTISLDADTTIQDHAATVAINQSLTGVLNNKWYFIQYEAPDMTYNTNTPLSGFDLTYAHGLATISLTRTSDTSLSYAVGYYKADGSRAELDGTDTIASGTYYFGMGCYGGVDGVMAMDNLSYAVPEPGTLASLVTALLSLLCYAWRKRR